MLYVQLGPVVNDFYEQIPSAVALCRALFQDFDIDEVLRNSLNGHPSYMPLAASPSYS